MNNLTTLNASEVDIAIAQYINAKHGDNRVYAGCIKIRLHPIKHRRNHPRRSPIKGATVEFNL